MERKLIDLDKGDWGKFVRKQFKILDLKLTHRIFPDGESYFRILENVKGKEIIIVCSLNNPNIKTIELILLCQSLRENGAKRVGLIAPYLPYMRQDKQFSHGEGITAKYYATIISENFNWLITVDPHLHRIPRLNLIYPITTRIIHAAPFISEWIIKNIHNPVIIGPDNESKQRVKKVASLADAAFVVLNKLRIGDDKVKETMPDLDKYKEYTPVLVDDIISTGETMLQAIKNLKKAKMTDPVCIGVHAVFAGNAYQELLDTGASKIVTCNTINHPSNEINICDGLAKLL